MVRKWRKTKVRAPLACDRKRSYNTYEAAVTAALLRVECGGAEFLRAYACKIPGCGSFHLTSKRYGAENFPAFEAVDEAGGA